MPRPADTAAGRVLHPDWTGGVNQDAAESVLVDRCTITRPGTTVPEFNTATLSAMAPVPTVVVEDEPCRVSYASGSTAIKRLLAAEEPLAANEHLVQLRKCVVDVQVGDVIEVTCSGDPDLTGRRLVVTKPLAASLSWTRLVRAEHQTHH